MSKTRGRLEFENALIRLSQALENELQSEEDEMRSSIGKEIDAERTRQDRLWGGPLHDDEHLPQHWASFISHQLGQLAVAHIDEERRLRLIKIAALSVAAIESMERLAAPKSYVCSECGRSSATNEPCCHGLD